MVEERGRAIITRLKKNQRSVIENFKDSYNVHISSTGRIAVVKKRDFKVEFLGGRIGIVTAGTADVPLAEEVRLLLRNSAVKPSLSTMRA